MGRILPTIAGAAAHFAETFRISASAVKQNGPLSGGHESGEWVGVAAGAVERALNLSALFISRTHVVQRGIILQWAQSP